ncbi:MAG: ATP phosphoribosyltransferase regulatory subunit [Thiomicrorhabdus sp.]|nr:ATP phosphoribosyltransferase regulatory subunit [Thiomicrorhabdus sp.]MCF6299188.1 ATP phosphoribosyltransferase regulatory subunit [Thiomicrorhabdus sp.]
MQQSTWFTPDGLEDLLPPQAQKLEYYRRKLMDGFNLSGYDLVLPPLAEFTDSLLTGTGRHLAVDTCRFTDQESGKMMGVRADMTPQVARIVSNRLKASEGISRLCYAGEVLKTRNNKAKGSRSPIQLGAELFGHAGVESDIEIIELMLESMQMLKLENSKVSLGHVGIVDELISLAGLNEGQAAQLIDIFERKALPEYEQFLAETTLPDNVADAFAILLTLCGEASKVIAQAKVCLSPISSTLKNAVERLDAVVSFLSTMHSNPIHLDLADIRGYQYHTGIIFACYSANGFLLPICKGGRYDNIGSEFGLALPATGFSLDLRLALDLLESVNPAEKGCIYAPLQADKTLQEKIVELKLSGMKVVKELDMSRLNAGDQFLSNTRGQWIVETV